MAAWNVRRHRSGGRVPRLGRADHSVRRRPPYLSAAHDRGIDGLVHRLHDRAYLALQVSEVSPSIAGTSGPYYELHFRPDGSSEPSRLDVYRIKLENLATEVANLL